MSLVRSSDPDFRVCQVHFADLLDLQLRAEREGWATRWSSEESLRGQVKESAVFLCPILREERNGEVRSYRCLILFPVAKGNAAGGVATIDIAPEVLASMERIDRDPQVRKALARIFTIASGGISMISKD